MHTATSTRNHAAMHGTQAQHLARERSARPRLCAGPDAYNSTLWPPRDFWRERLARHSEDIPACPSSIHDITFRPADAAAQDAVQAAESEDAAAGTQAAWEGGRRSFREGAMEFEFGPRCAHSCCRKGCVLGPLVISQVEWRVQHPRQATSLPMRNPCSLNSVHLVCIRSVIDDSFVIDTEWRSNAQAKKCSPVMHDKYGLRARVSLQDFRLHR